MQTNPYDVWTFGQSNDQHFIRINANVTHNAPSNANGFGLKSMCS